MPKRSGIDAPPCNSGAMKETSLYGHVVELLGRLEETRSPADAVVGEFFRTRHYLGARDRRFIAEVVFDVVRNRSLLNHVMQSAVSATPESAPEGGARLFVLLLTYLIVIRAVGNAEIAASIGALWSSYVRTASFDMCLKSISGAWTSFHWPESRVEHLALQHSIHSDIVAEWVQKFGPEEAGALCEASNSPPPISARVNTLQCSREECQESLHREGIDVTPTERSPVGLVFPKRASIQGLQAFRRGWFEMQDEGSQLLSYLLQPAAGERILDACAGAGGKTLHIAALMHNTGTIVATDSSRQRLANLEERKRRAGASVIHVVGGMTGESDERERRYDAVFIDAPCSGTGTYRRNPWLKQTFSREMLVQMTDTQQRLLRRYASDVKPGGRLVYATCSLLARENEEQVMLFLRDHVDFRLLPAGQILHDAGIPIDRDAEFLMLYPHRHGTDGFFGAVMQRSADAV